MTLDRDHRHTVVNRVMNLHVLPAERLLGSQEVPYSTLYVEQTFSRTDSVYHVLAKEFCYTC